MKDPAFTHPGFFIRLLFCLLATGLRGLAEGQITYYVNLNNANPMPPYISWATAATNIQDAVDVANGGDTVLVTNGVYAVGRREATVWHPDWNPPQFETTGLNRVVLAKAVVLSSVNGPGVTVIEGTPRDESLGGAVRCLFALTNAVISGFTLTNGIAAPHALGGGAYGGTLTNCVVTGNAVGGAFESVLHNCTVIGNSGFGVTGSTLYNCTVSGNSWSGAVGSTLYNCTVTGNSRFGVSGSTVYNSIVYDNRSGQHNRCTFAYSCTSPLPPGLGNIDAEPQVTPDGHLWPTSPCVAAGSTLYAAGVDMDAELWGDRPCMGSDQLVPGAVKGDLTMQIHPDDCHVDLGDTVTFVANKTGPITGLLWDFGDGSVATNQTSVSYAWHATGIHTVRLTGYNDSHPEGVITTVHVDVVERPTYYVNLNNPNPTAPYISWATAATNIQDAVDVAKAGDTVLVTNGVYRTGMRSQTNEWGELEANNRVTITNAIVLQSVNGPAVTVIEGAPFVTKDDTYVGGDVRCVFAVTNAVVSGFTLTKAGLYNGSGSGAYGGTLTNCVVTGNSGQAGVAFSILFNCTVSSNSRSGAVGSTLHSCTVTANSRAGVFDSTLYNCTVTANRGGGAVLSTLYNCTVTANSALLGMIAQYGGGAFRSTLYNCVLAGNKALLNGGGAYRCSLYNCTVTGNSVTWEDGGESYGQGGGCYGGMLYNCIVYNNQALNGPNWASDTDREEPIAFAYSCTSPLPTNGTGNIDADPRFVNTSAGDFRLRPDSPCVDTGTNLVGFPVTGWVDEFQDWGVIGQITDATDLFGYRRGGDGNGDGESGWDMGAYEYDPTVPIVTSVSITAAGLTIQWNVSAIGAKLQRATSLTQPDWEEMFRSEKTNFVVLPIWDGNEFFRLVKP